MPPPAPATTQEPPEATNPSRGTKRGAEDAGDDAPEAKRPRLPDIYVSYDYSDPEEEALLLALEPAAKLWKMLDYKPDYKYLITPDRPPRRLNSWSAVMELSEELDLEYPIPHVKGGVVISGHNPYADTPRKAAPARGKQSAVKMDGLVSGEEPAKGQNAQDAVLNLDLDVTMTDAESVSAAWAPSTSSVDATSSSSVPVAAAGSSAQEAALPIPEPVKTLPPSPIVAIDETVRQYRLQYGDKNESPRIPRERTWRRPGPSPLRQVITPDVPIPTPYLRPLFEQPRFWTKYLNPGEREDGTFVPAHNLRPFQRSRLPEYQEHRPRPPIKNRVKKTQRDLRVAPPLRTQLLKQYAWNWTFSQQGNVLMDLFYAKPRAPEFQIVFRMHVAQVQRRQDAKVGKRKRKYDCDYPRPVRGKGTPSGRDVPPPDRPRLVRPARRYRLTSLQRLREESRLRLPVRNA